MSPQVVVAAYLVAALCLLIPLAVVGSTFVGTVLWRRGRRPHEATLLASASPHGLRAKRRCGSADYR